MCPSPIVLILESCRPILLHKFWICIVLYSCRLPSLVALFSRYPYNGCENQLSSLLRGPVYSIVPHNPRINSVMNNRFEVSPLIPFFFFPHNLTPWSSFAFSLLTNSSACILLHMSRASEGKISRFENLK